MFGGKKKKDGKSVSKKVVKNTSQAGAKKARVKRIKSGTRRPVARTIAVVMALLMLISFVVPACFSVWNMFFGAKSKNMDFSSEQTQQLLQQLAELSKNQQGSEGEISSDGSSVNDESSEVDESDNEVEAIETNSDQESGSDETTEESDSTEQSEED